MLRRWILVLTLVLALTACALPRARVVTQAPAAATGPAETAAAGEGSPAAPTSTAAEAAPGSQPTVSTAGEAGATSGAEAAPTATPTPVVAGLGQPTAQAASAETPLPTPAAAMTATLAATPAGAISAPAQPASPRFLIQAGSPARVANFVRPNQGCNYTGVGGQVFSLGGVPVTGLVVEVSGTLEGADVLALGLTGSMPALGPGGYEIQLADRPAASTGALTVRLLDLNGVQISDAIAFDTQTVCEQNMTIINFVEAPATRQLFLPLTPRQAKLD